MKCPKCGYERRSVEEAPAWQCPSCKVAYAKVGLASGPVAHPAPTRAASSAETAERIAQIEEDEQLSLAAGGQKIAIYCIVLNMGLQGVSRNQSLPSLVVLILSILVGIYALVGVVRMCSGLARSQNAKIAFMVTSFVPLLNIASLIYLSARTTKALRKAGWRVGLLGAKP